MEARCGPQKVATLEQHAFRRQAIDMGGLTTVVVANRQAWS